MAIGFIRGGLWCLVLFLMGGGLELKAQEDLGNQRPEPYVMSKEAQKRFKTLTGVWDLETIEVSGRTINYKEHDEMQVSFYIRVKEKKDKETNKKTKSTHYFYKANWPARGVDRIFEFYLPEQADSIIFIGVKGFNDMKIVQAYTQELVLEQVSDGNIQTLNFKRLATAVETNKPKKKPKKGKR